MEQQLLLCEHTSSSESYFLTTWKYRSVREGTLKEPLIKVSLKSMGDLGFGSMSLRVGNFNFCSAGEWPGVISTLGTAAGHLSVNNTVRKHAARRAGAVLILLHGVWDTYLDGCTCTYPIEKVFGLKSKNKIKFRDNTKSPKAENCTLLISYEQLLVFKMR